jgi:hypothetical protein
LFVSDVLPCSQWRAFVVSRCQRSELRSLPSISPWLFFLSKLTRILITDCCRQPLPLLTAVDSYCRTSFITTMLTRLSFKCFLQLEISQQP